MRFRARSRTPLARLFLALAALAAFAVLVPRHGSLRAQVAGPGPTFSSPILLDPTDSVLVAVNPDNDSIAVIPTNSANQTEAQTFAVGREPQSLALLPSPSLTSGKVYVSNAVDGTVTVLQITALGAVTRVKDIKVGTEPWGIALTPNGTRLYVANSGSDSLSVINTTTDEVVKTIFRVGRNPRGLAITSDGDLDDTDEKVYVTNFLAQYRPDDIRPGDDLGKVGVVSVVSTATNELVRITELQPIADTGFKSNGDALHKIAPVAADSCTPTPACTFTITTGAFPNILASAVIKNNHVYVPATGSSPNGPVRFNVNVQGLVCQIDTISDADAGLTVNLNNGIGAEADSTDAALRPLKRFVTNPYFIAFRHKSNSGYVVSAASDMIVKMDVDGTGKPTINAPANIKRVLTGSNPRAMVIDQNDARGYVWNYVSRDVTVVDLTTDTAVARFQLAKQPTDPEAIKIQRGKELFNTSIGPIFPVVSGTPPTTVLEGAMADRGWVSCASCHPNGLTDGVAWMFPAGPRVSTPLNATWGPAGVTQRALNWSAIFDEVADFELNTRGVAGGSGLIRNQDGTPDPNVNAFTVPSAGRSADRDSITDYVRFGIRSPISPIPAGDVRAGEGRKVFAAAGCARCHGGPNWTISHLEFPPPPPASALVAEQGTSQLIGQLKQVGTFNPAATFELVGTGGNISKQALGQAGFNPPSLRGIQSLGPYLHNGTAVTLEEILDNPTHMGAVGSALLSVGSRRKQLVQFLRSIDDSTVPFTVPTVEREPERRMR